MQSLYKQWEELCSCFFLLISLVNKLVGALYRLESLVAKKKTCIHRGSILKQEKRR